MNSKAGAPASLGLKAIRSASSAVQAEMGALTSRLGPVGSALISVGPAGLAAAANAAAEAERADRTLETILKATGQAVGLTGMEIEVVSPGLA